MIVIVGLAVLFVAAAVGFAGVLANAGPAHSLTDGFSVFGYHVTGSTGTLFLFGIMVGAAAMLGLSVLLAGARRTAGRGRDARNALARSQREAAFLNQEREQRLEHQQDGASSGPTVSTGPERDSLFSRWSRGRQPTPTARIDTFSPRSRAMNTENQGVRNEHR
ncbi:hypothetical protein [Mycobacterium sp. DL440]|uniref:hypothetical protein n=1 Tax=Mycobacterium sp. DL440 TaxID=2675523 RepID=UPI00142451DE|nr:hypothetical protein [Mycobacterium sp. DL440]